MNETRPRNRMVLLTARMHSVFDCKASLSESSKAAEAVLIPVILDIPEARVFLEAPTVEEQSTSVSR